MQEISSYQQNVSFKSLNQAKFNRIFPVFLANTDEKAQMIDGMRSVFRQKLTAPHLDVLDIGCGDGFTAGQIYDSIQNLHHAKRFSVVAIDNNQSLLDAYSSRFDGKTGFDKVETQKRDIFAEADFRQEADLEIVSHSLYHAPRENLGRIIQSTYDSLKKGGVAVVSMLRGDSDFNVIQRNYGKYVTDSNETNPVGVTLDDIKKEITANPKIAANTSFAPYKAYVYFPKNSYADFFKWQLATPQAPAPNPNAQKTLDLLEFVVHGDLEKLRQKRALGNFMATVSNMFSENGRAPTGENRINFNGENIFIQK